MGLENSNEGKRTYLNVVGGRFALSVDKDTPGAVERKNKKDKIVYELLYDSLSGVKIKKIEKDISNDFGASWKVTLQEVDQTFILNLPYSGRITNGLLFRLLNIDFTQEVNLKLFTKEEKTYLTVYDSDDVKIEAAYSKDKPNGLPPLEHKMIKGKMGWDDTLQMEYIEEMINTIIIPQLDALTTEVKEEQEPELPVNPDLADDLPF